MENSSLQSVLFSLPDKKVPAAGVNPKKSVRIFKNDFP